MTFREKLCAAQKHNNSWLCVGLDPDLKQMPSISGQDISEKLFHFCKGVIEATHDLVCAFKPNLAFFLAHGTEGLKALESVIRIIPQNIPIVLDAKMGDIGNTQRLYGQAIFGALGVDAVTVSPYMGDDVIIPLAENYPDKGAYIVCRSSNQSGGRFQSHPGRAPYLYEQVAEVAKSWAEAYPSFTIGLVVGATQPEEMISLRKMVPGLPFLIPGIGAQGGELDIPVQWGAALDGPGPLINVSRAVLYASSGSDYTQAARNAADMHRSEINRVRKTI